jgi:DNA-directed RNA polymerase specialized sigma24 family protein
MIETFYRQNRRKLVNFIKGYVDYELAEDVVQEVFLRLLVLESEGKTHFIQEGKVNFFFVYRACVNLCFKISATKKKIQKISFGDMYDLDKWLAASTDEYNHEEDRTWEELVSAIGDEMKAIRWYDAQVLEISTNYTISALSRGTGIGRDSIRQTLKKTKNEIRERTEESYQAWKEAQRRG